MPNRSNKQKKASHKGAGELRLIGGFLRGRKLSIADLPGLRPTTDRIRETLFNWLQFELAQQRVLDAFAGSGALGFEALSRGAASVTLLERNKQAATLLQQHAKVLNQAMQARDLAEPCQAEALATDALTYLAQPAPQQFDVVFIDPPFQQGLADKCIAALEQQQWLAPDSWVYVETEANWIAQVPPHWHLYREKRAGQVAFRLYKVTSTNVTPIPE
ncbi:16S rRNA (guanine(966)-N(2))-methyltransferase RsmD [Pseudidiomarina sp. GXY010]|uniref:Ribosomal RNA small subunit methyltransferase D n=1 Tax=Pseudidiomarina fusca TaxID=2965078 RepID=A0ABU3KYG8_9GAMM|nr:16S rRNA (guanine(966)-N(2))-methyltransferase RsmD [Pseudidiomarina sp. GXY010]MDT7526555.1 16S rRNA (guanine(966)-N(2))-methyltransferase RsmD [Pseudidiomarina sp. GXY010]